MSRAGSMPGITSVATNPPAVSRITQRSVTYSTSCPSSRARRPENVTCSTLSTILANLPGVATRSPCPVSSIPAPASNQPENTILRARAVMSTKPPQPAVR
jgi:hypothetical protein